MLSPVAGTAAATGGGPSQPRGRTFGQGKYEEAVASYRRALELKPDLPETLNGLATAYALLDDPDHAVACYRRAIELKPNYAEALNNLGNALKDQAKLDESLACYRRAIELDPAFDSARNNLLYAMSFCPGVDAAAIYEEHRRWNEQYARAAGQVHCTAYQRSIAGSPACASAMSRPTFVSTF